LAATEALLAEVERRGLRAVVGKTSMDRGAPAPLLTPADRDRADNEHLIRTWHGRHGRIFIALTPRFALSCTDALLASLGELAAQHPGVYVQTHHAETEAEIAAVARAFPSDADYLAVYARHGLVRARTILGHCVHASSAELRRIAEAEAGIAHCPTSNMFLGSGLFPLAAAERAGARIALGSDIGAGTSLSALRTMDAAYQVQQLRGDAVSPVHLLHLATLGGARALHLDADIGSLAVGKRADLVVLDPRRSRLLAPRWQASVPAHERLSALITLGDDRIVERVVVDGVEVHRS
jgi:guanine deaminase